MLNELYQSQWKLYLNYFTPSFKLTEKKRDGSKIIKIFSSPHTPYQRLLASEGVSPTKKKELAKTFNSLDLFTLKYLKVELGLLIRSNIIIIITIIIEEKI